MQRLDRALQILFSYDHAQVEQRRPLRNHPYVDEFERVKHARGHTGRVADVIAHQANDRLMLLHRDLGEVPQLSANLGKPLRIIDGQ